LFLLGHEFIEGPLLHQLGHRAQGEAEHCNGGAQLEGLLNYPCRREFVVAEADAKTAAIALTAWAA
jgi:hypothetical protein